MAEVAVERGKEETRGVWLWRGILLVALASWTGALIQLGLPAIAVHVDRKCCIPHLSQHTRALPHVFVMPPPFMDHQHGRTLPFHRRICC